VTISSTVDAGDGEGDADIAAGRREDGRVDADHLALRVEGRAAGIAAVHGRVDLQEIVVRSGADVAAFGRDDAGRDRAAEAERVADGEHPLPDLRLLLRKLGELEAVAVDLQEREVGAVVGADQLRGVLLAIVGHDGDFRLALHHVVVGDDVAVLGDEEARTLAHAAARRVGPAAVIVAVVAEAARHAEAAEELVQRVVVGQVVEALRKAAAAGDRLDVGLHLHAHHRRLHLLDDGGKVRRRRGLHIDRLREGELAVAQKRAGAAAGNSERDDARQQRVAHAPASRTGSGLFGHGPHESPLVKTLCPPRRRGADWRRADGDLGGENSPPTQTCR
jgi:hypothetical protein